MKLSRLAVLALPLTLLAATDDTAVANRKWVRETIAQYATSTTAQDDELHTDGTNIWVCVAEAVNGTVTNRPYYLDCEIRTVTGDNCGATVVQSDNPQVPVGTLLAACRGTNGPELCNREKPLLYTHPSGGTLAIGPLFSAGLAQTALSDQYGAYTNHAVSGTATATYTNRFGRASLAVTRTVSCRPIHTQFIDVTETVAVADPAGWSDTTAVYHYRLRGTTMTDEAFARISAGATGYRWPWSALSGHATAERQLILRQRTESQARARGRLRTMSTASASDGGSLTEIVSPLPLRSEPLVDFVDAFTYASNGETSETHWPLPSDYVPSREQWYDPMRWFQSYPDSPFPITVKVDITLASGRIIRGKTTRINGLEQLERLGVNVIASAWPAPTFERKEDQCARGHVYGADCVCIVCRKSRRPHQFDFSRVADGQCARCSRPYDAWTTDRHGVKIPNGRTLDAFCDAPNGTDGDLALHRGWLASENPDDDRFFCDCECGFYHRIEPLRHELPQEDDIRAWTDLGDGVHHYADLDCMRGCGGIHRETREHTPDAETALPDGETRKYKPLDDGDHLVWARCSATGCAYLGWVPEAHVFTDDDPCYCTKCETYVHTWTTVACGRFQNSFCSKCGLALKGGESGHDYGFPLKAGDPNVDTHHACACARGPLQAHEFRNGTCTVCGYEKPLKGGLHKCSGRVRSDGKPSTRSDHTQGAWYDSYVLSGASAFGSGGDSGGPACPDCGNDFFRDNPAALKNVENEMYFFTYFSPPSGGRETVRGYASSLRTGLPSARATYEAFLGQWTGNRAFANMPFTVVVQHSPVTNEITDAFTSTSRTLVHFDEATYSGTVVEGDDGQLHIEWD